MKIRLLLPFAFALSLAAPASMLAATPGVNSRVVTPGTVVPIYTAMNHVAVIDEPEPVIQVALGDSHVHVEWHGNSVFLEPEEDGVSTNLVVFTQHYQLTYELIPVEGQATPTAILNQVVPPPPPPTPRPTPAQVQHSHDALFGKLLLTSRMIVADHGSTPAGGIDVRIVSVSDDASNYYVRLRITNEGTHLYRFNEPTVSKVMPSFGIAKAYNWMNHQIPTNSLKKYHLLDAQPVTVHGATLGQRDIQPGGSVDWVMALNKPSQTPGIYKFSFGADDGIPVFALAEF